MVNSALGLQSQRARPAPKFPSPGLRCPSQTANHDPFGRLRHYIYRDWSRLEFGSENEVVSEPDPGAAAAFRKIFDYVGAFPLLEDSKDAATVVRLGPGSYTVIAATDSDDPGGEALLEVYFLASKREAGQR